MTDDFDYDTYSRKFDDSDLLRQTTRTVNGEPISDEQLALVRSRIADALSLGSNDYMLDLCCGNGHLVTSFFDTINRYIGVDISENLIRIANKYFASPPRVTFHHEDAVRFIRSVGPSEPITKMLWYGSCQYFQEENVVCILDSLFKNCTQLTKIFIGNLPDREQAHTILSEEKCRDAFLDNHRTVFGKWRSRDDFKTLISKTGWALEVWDNDESYHGKHYRYDLLLTREGNV